MKKLLLICIIISSLCAHAQNNEVPFLIQELTKAKTEMSKINALRALCFHYSAFQVYDSGRYYAIMALKIADESSDPIVKIEANFIMGNSWHSNKGINEIEREKKAQEYFNKSLQLATSIKDPIRQAWSHYAISYSFLSPQQQLDEALKANSIALEYPKDDSLFIYSYLRLSNAYSYLWNTEQTYICLDKALVRAVETNNPIRLRSVYRILQTFYRYFGNSDKELEMIEKLIELTKKDGNISAKINDIRNKGNFIRLQAIGKFSYKMRLAGTQSENTYDKDKLEQAETYLSEAINLLHTSKTTISGTELNTLYSNNFWTYFALNQPEKIVHLENSFPVFFNAWKKSKGKTYQLNKGAYYYLVNQFDSAKSCFDTCIKYQYREPYLYHIYFMIFLKEGDKEGMIRLLENVRDIFRSEDIREVQSGLLALDSLYQEKGNYQKAQACLMEYIHIGDSLTREDNDKKIGLLAVSSQEKILGKQREKELAATNRRHSIQYTGIVIGIVAVFLLLALLGLYRVSPKTIRVLGFFAFLLFFEFLFLVFKKYLAPLTHEEPIKELMFMIILAAVLIPLHHWVEHKVFHFLTSNKMFIARKSGWRRRSDEKARAQQETKEA